MASTNYVTLKEFTDDIRCVQAKPGMVVAFDPAVRPDKVASLLSNGVILIATDTTNTHPVMVALQRLATAA
jgi:hypothetical protein